MVQLGIYVYTVVDSSLVCSKVGLFGCSHARGKKLWCSLHVATCPFPSSSIEDPLVWALPIWCILVQRIPF